MKSAATPHCEDSKDASCWSTVYRTRVMSDANVAIARDVSVEPATVNQSFQALHSRSLVFPVSPGFLQPHALDHFLRCELHAARRNKAAVPAGRTPTKTLARFKNCDLEAVFGRQSVCGGETRIAGQPDHCNIRCDIAIEFVSRQRFRRQRLRPVMLQPLVERINLGIVNTFLMILLSFAGHFGLHEVRN